eukprot:6492434-Amphidinium_carterae.2
MVACDRCDGYAYKHVKSLARPCPGPLAKNATQRRRLDRNLFPQGGVQGGALPGGADRGDIGKGHKSPNASCEERALTPWLSSFLSRL